LIARLARSLQEARDFITTLSLGKLDVAAPPRNHLIAPFKQLQASLRHLTWQTQQIAAGDLNQRVDFLGEFSVAFNTLIDALREKDEAEERVRYLSHHDPLTDLYNRGYFEEEMARTERGRRFPVSIMMADLDGLKKINDSLGHAVGDRLIRAAADVIRKSVRAEDVVARVGGDEFALILPETDVLTVEGVLARIRENEMEFNRECIGYQVLISIGIATVEEGGSLSDAMKKADERMYQDKFARKERRQQDGERAVTELLCRD
jgi:diguanylate cyclase (GGDEF)-like protein